MNALKLLRWISLGEGLSYLSLLCIGMPLKYGMGIPAPNRVLGSVHGLLTLLFIISLFRVVLEQRWDARKTAFAFAASLIPFGAFWLERRLREETALTHKGES